MCIAYVRNESIQARLSVRSIWEDMVGITEILSILGGLAMPSDHQVVRPYEVGACMSDFVIYHLVHEELERAVCIGRTEAMFGGSFESFESFALRADRCASESFLCHTGTQKSGCCIRQFFVGLTKLFPVRYFHTCKFLFGEIVRPFVQVCHA